MTDAPRDTKGNKKQTCSGCGVLGHNKRWCPEDGHVKQPRHR